MAFVVVVAACLYTLAHTSPWRNGEEGSNISVVGDRRGQTDVPTSIGTRKTRRRPRRRRRRRRRETRNPRIPSGQVFDCPIGPQPLPLSRWKSIRADFPLSKYDGLLFAQATNTRDPWSCGTCVHRRYAAWYRIGPDRLADFRMKGERLTCGAEWAAGDGRFWGMNRLVRLLRKFDIRFVTFLWNSWGVEIFWGIEKVCSLRC